MSYVIIIKIAITWEINSPILFSISMQLLNSRNRKKEIISPISLVLEIHRFHNCRCDVITRRVKVSQTSAARASCLGDAKLSPRGIDRFRSILIYFTGLIKLAYLGGERETGEDNNEHTQRERVEGGGGSVLSPRGERKERGKTEPRACSAVFTIHQSQSNAFRC